MSLIADIAVVAFRTTLVAEQKLEELRRRLGHNHANTIARLAIARSLSVPDAAC